MDQTFDLILTVLALGAGIMLMTGHGDVFMKGGDPEARKRLYDEKKMAKASGLALILVGVVTGIDMFTTAFAAKIAYLIAIVAIFVILIWYVRKKCRK